MSYLRLGTLGASPPPQSPHLAAKESTIEEHTQQMKKRGALRQSFFVTQHGCIVHGKVMSYLRLGTPGARPPPQSPQLAAKGSTIEEHTHPRRRVRLSLWQVCNFGVTTFFAFLQIGLGCMLYFMSNFIWPLSFIHLFFGEVIHSYSFTQWVRPTKACGNTSMKPCKTSRTSAKPA